MGEREEAEKLERERIVSERERMEKEFRDAEEKEKERKEAEKREIERKNAERLHNEWKKEEALKDAELASLTIPLKQSNILDIHGNPLKLSDTRRNTLAEGLGWFSSWDRDSNKESEKKSSW